MDLQDLDHLRDLIKSQGLIPAIKEIRERTGLGLKESKDIAELIQRGAGIFEVSAALGGVSFNAAAPAPAPSGEVERLAKLGRKIEAIKLYRELHNVGLREAKDAVEAMA